jgi:hypothetical protein
MTTTPAQIRTPLILARLCRFGMKEANKKATTITGIITEKNQADGTDSIDSGCIPIRGMDTNAENTAPAMTKPIPTDTMFLKVVSLAIENPSLSTESLDLAESRCFNKGEFCFYIPFFSSNQ